MSLKRTTLSLTVAAACALAAFCCVPRPAAAATASNPVIADCLAHPGGLTGHYTVSQLQTALNVMPAETKEYTSCPDVVNRALLAALGSGSGTTGTTSGSSSSFLPTPVIIVLVVLVLAAITFGAIAIRRRQQEVASGAGVGAADGSQAGVAAAGDAQTSEPQSPPASAPDDGEAPAGTSPAGERDD
jgi:hypothetical protein